MSNKNIAVYGIFSDRNTVEVAILDLQTNGFRSTDMSVLFSDNRSAKEFAAEKNTKAPEGATVGASAGAAIGGTLGLLAGIGALAIPVLGPFIAAGPIVGLLAGAGVGGTVGGITGALIGMGLPEYEAKRFEGIIKGGGILLSVHCDSTEWADKAKEILEHKGAEDVSSAGEGRAQIKIDAHNQPVAKGF